MGIASIIQKRLMKFIIFGLFSLSAFISVAQKPEVFQKDGLAIHGYDPVAFFSQGKAEKGSDLFSIIWKDAKWNFTSQTNLDSFKNNSAKYAPQFGGYCAYGMSKGYKAPTEPDTWSIINDKLYFNYNQKIKAAWLKQTEAYIRQAETNWLTVKNS